MGLRMFFVQSSRAEVTSNHPDDTLSSLHLLCRAGIRYQSEHASLFERHSLAFFGFNFFSILVNNLETGLEIKMKEDLENDLTEEEDACDDVKNDSKSSRVYLTKPSDDLNRRYMIDKFHPSTAKSKKVPYESIDLSVYKPSAKCLS